MVVALSENCNKLFDPSWVFAVLEWQTELLEHKIKLRRKRKGRLILILYEQCNNPNPTREGD